MMILYGRKHRRSELHGKERILAFPDDAMGNPTTTICRYLRTVNISHQDLGVVEK